MVIIVSLLCHVAIIPNANIQIKHKNLSTYPLYWQARRIIAMLGQDFIFDGCTILVHGFSRVVLEVLKTAAQNKKLFRVFCTGFFLNTLFFIWMFP